MNLYTLLILLATLVNFEINKKNCCIMPKSIMFKSLHYLVSLAAIFSIVTQWPGEEHCARTLKARETNHYWAPDNEIQYDYGTG